MSNSTTIIYCGTAGAPLPDKQIWIYRGTVMDFAVRIDGKELEKIVGHKEAVEFEKKFADYHSDLISWLQAHGVPYTVHQPHQQNF